MTDLKLYLIEITDIPIYTFTYSWAKNGVFVFESAVHLVKVTPWRVGVHTLITVHVCSDKFTR